MSILKRIRLATKETAAAGAETESVRRIVEALEQLDPQEARYLAAFAYVLGRVARADLKVSPEETRQMERIVIERGGLPEPEAILAVQIAKAQNRLFGATENFVVTREFNQIASREQKLALLDCLYEVAAAEEAVSVVEDNEIRQIASELRLSHDDYIAVRLKHRDRLSILKKPGA